MSYEKLEDFKNSSQLIDKNEDAQFGWKQRSRRI